MREISFEMAQELGLIPRASERYLTVQFPFESYHAFKDRQEAGELGYRFEMESLKREYEHVYFRGEKLKVV